MRVTQLLSCQLGTAVPASKGAETPEEGASGGSPEGSINELVTVQECPPWAVPDRDHRGTGEAPPRIYLVCDDHSVESRRPTSGNQTASLGTPCPSCLHPPQKRQRKGVFGGQKHVGQPNLPQEGRAGGAGCICIAGAIRGAVSRVGRRTRRGT